MHYYLTYLFNTYSAMLNFKSIITENEIMEIISKVKDYLLIFEQIVVIVCSYVNNFFGVSVIM